MCRHTIIIVIPYVYMHYINGQNTFLWNGRRVITESIMKKKTWKFHIILLLITKMVNTFYLLDVILNAFIFICNIILPKIEMKRNMFKTIYFSIFSLKVFEYVHCITFSEWDKIIKRKTIMQLSNSCNVKKRNQFLDVKNGEIKLKVLCIVQCVH